MEQSNISTVLNRLMFEAKLKTTELARRVNLPQPTVHRIVTGASPNPHHSSLLPLANFFNVTINQLKGLEPIQHLTVHPVVAVGKRIPLLSQEELFTHNHTDDKPFILTSSNYIYTDANVSEQAYALCMEDSSMEPLFPKGTHLIFDPTKTPRDRSYVLVLLADQNNIIFRQLLIDAHQQYIKPLSPDLEQFNIRLLGNQDKILSVLVQAKQNYQD